MLVLVVSMWPQRSIEGTRRHVRAESNAECGPCAMACDALALPHHDLEGQQEDPRPASPEEGSQRGHQGGAM